MHTVILAGGFGTRLSEETTIKPKPLVEIGGYPIIWHILNYYSSYGHRDFTVCGGYKVEAINQYFINMRNNRDVRVDLGSRVVEYLSESAENWIVNIIDTGQKTETGGRLLRISNLVSEPEFMFTYGDGLSNVDLDALITFHRKMGRVCTLTSVPMPPRFGCIEENSGIVTDFKEKGPSDSMKINGGFFVANRRLFDYILGDGDSFEYDVLPRLVRDGQLAAFSHFGFWHAMDTLRDKTSLEKVWATAECPWRRW